MGTFQTKCQELQFKYSKQSVHVFKRIKIWPRMKFLLGICCKIWKEDANLDCSMSAIVFDDKDLWRVDVLITSKTLFLGSYCLQAEKSCAVNMTLSKQRGQSNMKPWIYFLKLNSDYGLEFQVEGITGTFRLSDKMTFLFCQL